MSPAIGTPRMKFPNLTGAIAYLRSEMDRAGATQEVLASKAGLSLKAINDLLNARRTPTTSTLKVVDQALMELFGEHSTGFLIRLASEPPGTSADELLQRETAAALMAPDNNLIAQIERLSPRERDLVVELVEVLTRRP